MHLLPLLDGDVCPCGAHDAVVREVIVDDSSADVRVHNSDPHHNFQVSSLLLPLLELLRQGAVHDHLFREARVDALLLVHVELFALEALHTVVEALRAGVEEKARGGLEVNEALVCGGVHSI